MEKVWVYCG